MDIELSLPGEAVLRLSKSKACDLEKCGTTLPGPLRIMLGAQLANSTCQRGTNRCTGFAMLAFCQASEVHWFGTVSNEHQSWCRGDAK